MKFVVVGCGDWSVGIPSSHSVVTFDADGLVWNNDLIEHTKAMLREWDDNGTEVFTEEEYDELMNYEEEAMRE